MLNNLAATPNEIIGDWLSVQLINYIWQFMVRAQVNNFVESSNYGYNTKGYLITLLDTSEMIQPSFLNSH